MITDFIFGSNTIKDAFVGGKSVKPIYLGETLIWPLSSPSDVNYLLNEENKTLLTEDDLNYINADRV